MSQVESGQIPQPSERWDLPLQAFSNEQPLAVGELLECLRNLPGDELTFVLLRETPLDARCINHGDIDLLGTMAAVEGLLARCYALAQAGRCHFRVTRKKEGHVGLVLFSRCGQFRLHFDLWIDLWQLDGGRRGLRFADVAHLLPRDRSGYLRLPVSVEAAIYLHHFFVQRKSTNSKTVWQRLAFYTEACQEAGAPDLAADFVGVRQQGHVEQAVLDRAMRLLKSHEVVPSLVHSWHVVRQRWIARWRRWWLGSPRHPAVISFMGCDGAGKTSLSESLSKGSSLSVTVRPFTGRNLYRKSLIYRTFGSLVRRSRSMNRDRFDEKYCVPLYLYAAAHLRRKVYWRQLLGSRKLLVMDRTLVDLLYTQRLSDEARFGRWVHLAEYFGVRLPTVHFIVDFEQLCARKAECSEIAHRQYDEDMFWFHVRRIPTDYTVFSNFGTFDDSKTALTQIIQANWPRHRAA